MPLSLTRRRGELIQFQFPEDITEEELKELLQTGISVKLADISGNQAHWSLQPRKQSLSCALSFLIRSQ